MTAPAAKHAVSPGDRRAITVFTTADGRPCNKVVSRKSGGGIDKQRAKSGRYAARTVPIKDLVHLAAVLRGVGARVDQMISLSLFVDPPEGVDEWQVWACWELAERLCVDKHDREALKGFHWVDGAWVTARIKENMVLGAFLLFDRDMSAGMPATLAELDAGDWRRALASLFPGADTCGCAVMPSTTNRIVVDGVREVSRSCHMIVEVTDPDAVESAWDQACHRSLITSFAPAPWDDEACLAFAKPIHDRKNGTGAVIGHSWWTIFDRSTWSVGREVFDGAPHAMDRGIEILPPEVVVHDGPPLDLSLVQDLTTSELVMVADVVRDLIGIRPTMKAARKPGKDGKPRVCGLSITVPDLNLDLDVESEAGWTTVRAIMQSGAAHVRLQSPFRESDSWAAFYGVHDDGIPFVFDMGTREKHVLARLGLKHIWEHISEWLVDEYQPVFRYPDGGIFSADRQRKVLLRDVKPAPDVLRALRLASNTPLTASGAPKENALPTEFHKWLPFAWTDRLRSLPLEDEAHVNDAAGEEFKAWLARLLTAMVQSDGGGRWLRRALGTWCHYYATIGPSGEWSRVGTFEAWGRLADAGAFQIGLRQGLAAQVSRTNHPELCALDNHSLALRCRKYGILSNLGDNRVRVGKQQVRMTILTVEFVASLHLSTDHNDPHAAALHAELAGDPSLHSREGLNGPIH